ncbi:hypothetical protein OBBRIDRAFT_839282 [Obba rivulosa]|uniref:Uncharacterized protein n=1 Tax=Obba rivulosa TaxID=1052685 RepID=A0A8E2DGP3_9APHY|nr:hypothetical protein OBBRIDRAFT_839282 [Obba rivulosa]
MLPTLYTTVSITTSSSIRSFSSALTTSWFAVQGGKIRGPSLASLVRHIWIDPTSSTEQSDLVERNSRAWPVKILPQIFYFCSSLRALALMHLDGERSVWLESRVPASVEHFFLGPSHIHSFRLNGLATCKRDLRSITIYGKSRWMTAVPLDASAFHRFRQFVNPGIECRSNHMRTVFGYLRHWREMSSLHEIQIICCVEDVEAAAADLRCFAEDYQEDYQDQRVRLISQPSKWGGELDTLRSYYEDWRREITLQFN